MDKNEEKLLRTLSAYFTTHFMGLSDMHSDGGCDTCGDGSVQGMTLEAITDIIDKFIRKGGKI